MPNLSGIAENTINLDRLTEYDEAIKEYGDERFLKTATDKVTSGKMIATTVATGATAEGIFNTVNGDYSHAEGMSNTIHTQAAHAEGINTVAGSSGDSTTGAQHAEGRGTAATGANSHSQNLGTIAAGQNQTALGKYNVADNEDEYAVVVGNGTSETDEETGETTINRSNALTVDWSGNVAAAGEITDGSGNSLSDLPDYTRDVTFSGCTMTVVKGDGTVTTADFTIHADINDASESQAGAVKLYQSSGNNTDGAMSQAATATAIQAAISAIQGMSVVVLNGGEDLPATGAECTFYFKPSANGTGNAYDEYLWVDSLHSYEKMGSTDFNPNNYYTKTQADARTVTSVTGTPTASGETVTITMGDNTTTTFDIVDTKYGTGTSSTAGLTKLYTTTGDNVDGTMDQNTLTTALAGKLGATDNAVSATKATNDYADQRIDTTYIKGISASGTTLTLIKGDDTTSTITTQDTTYSTGTAATAGIGKLYTATGNNTDGAMTQDAITSAINTAIAGVNSFDVVVLGDQEDLPVTGAAHTIYFVPDVTATGDNYAEYMWMAASSLYEKIGTTDFNAANYYTQTQTNNQITASHNTSITGVSASGTTLTVTKGDGTTSTVTTQDTTYSTGTASTAGIGKLYAETGSNTDGSMTQSAITTAIANATVSEAYQLSSDNGANALGENVLLDYGDEG